MDRGLLSLQDKGIFIRAFIPLGVDKAAVTHFLLCCQ